MKMIATPAAVLANTYPTYIHNCQRLKTCEPSFSAPLPGVPYLQLYVDFGSTKPSSVEFQLINPCLANVTEQIFPSNYVVGQTPEGNWYGVFKYFNSPLTPVTTFVVWLSAMTTGGEKTFFSEMLVVEPCAPLTKIKSCQPGAATTVGFDINGLYYGVPVNVDYLGISAIRYFHIAYVRQGKVREISNKGTFKSSLYANFRTTIEKIHQLETELVPKWYKDVLLAIYSRGAIQVNDTKVWLVSELAFEGINDDDLTWKPFVQLRETFRLFYGCDDSECIECCSPIVLASTVISNEDNQITVQFDPCEPTPANGYKVFYRVIGSGPYIAWSSNFTTSPAIFNVAGAFGASYEGYIQGDCGDGQLGVPIPWEAINDESLSESISESVSESVSESEPALEGVFEVWADISSVSVDNITGITNDITYPVAFPDLIAGNWTGFAGGTIFVDISGTAGQDGNITVYYNGGPGPNVPFMGDGIYPVPGLSAPNPGDTIRVRVRP